MCYRALLTSRVSVEVRIAAKCTKMHRTVPTKYYPAPNVNCSKAEKLWYP